MRDPNPLVAGRGFQQLRAAGIRVDCRADSDPDLERARRLNEAFAWWIRKRRPFVTLKTALTLDGSVVLPRSPNGNPRGSESRWITSEISRAEVHRMRHASDAIMTGIGTILADDPLLTDRSGLPRRRPLLRVVLDSRLRLPLHVIGILPATENMPGGRAIKPGDILTTLSGKTVEVQNTDAEGRLILADGLAYATRLKPAAIIDIATLTGACMVALGQFAVGMFSNSDTLKKHVQQAGDKAGERVWEMPLWDEYFEQLRSDVADMRNIGGRGGGMITAAIFLSKFVGDWPWVHLDIASTDWSERERAYIPKGPTGIGTRLLIQYLIDEATASRSAGLP